MEAVFGHHRRLGGVLIPADHCTQCLVLGTERFLSDLSKNPLEKLANQNRPVQPANHSCPPPPTNQNAAKTFGMAKWRASQKARRQLQTIEAASEIDRKPYHFDEGTHFLDIYFTR